MIMKMNDETKKAAEKMKRLLPKRASDANKGDFGRIFLLGGSLGMTGSVCLSAEAALRSGAGLVTVGTVNSQRPIVAVKLTEAMTVGYDETDGTFSGKDSASMVEKINSSNVCAFGMGFSRGNGAKKTVFDIAGEAEKPLVIDADGINAVSENIDILKRIKAGAVLTPHPGEMSRLTGISIAEIQKNRSHIAEAFSKKYNAVVVLKGEKTVVAAPDGRIYINPTGNCGMATGGSGDVLSGIIASFIGQGMELYEAAVLSVYLHGRAGDIGAERYTVFGLRASDIVEALPAAIRELLD